MIRVAIIGASGYTGAESIKILLQHNEAELTYLTALPEECGAVEDVFPQFKGRCALQIEPLDFDKLSDLLMSLYVVCLISLYGIRAETFRRRAESNRL